MEQLKTMHTLTNVVILSNWMFPLEGPQFFHQWVPLACVAFSLCGAAFLVEPYIEQLQPSVYCGHQASQLLTVTTDNLGKGVFIYLTFSKIQSPNGIVQTPWQGPLLALMPPRMIRNTRAGNQVHHEWTGGPFPSVPSDVETFHMPHFLKATLLGIVT